MYCLALDYLFLLWLRVYVQQYVHTLLLLTVFKNNCPCNGSLYDDFRICDVKTGEVIYTIVPSDGFKKTKGKAIVWGRENDFEEPCHILEGIRGTNRKHR